MPTNSQRALTGGNARLGQVDPISRVHNFFHEDDSTRLSVFVVIWCFVPRDGEMIHFRVPLPPS